MYVLNQGSTENDMISDVFLLYLGHDLLQCRATDHVSLLGDKIDLSDDKWFVRLYCDSLLRQYISSALKPLFAPFSLKII